ncbi:MAG TPA: hypothetical protein VGI66_17690 [Streptosporangiaceae bacterium]
MAISQVVTSALRYTKVRWRTAGSVRQGALILAATGLTMGASLLSAGAASAAAASAHGSQPGRLVFTPTSGAATVTPTWSTTDACPSGFQKSAQLSLFNPNGSFASRISPVVASPTSAFHGTLLGSVGAVLSVTTVPKGGTVEFAMGCYSQIAGTGKVKWVQSTFLTISSTGTSFSTSSTSPKSATGLQASTTANGQQASGSATGHSSSGGHSSASGQADSAYATKVSSNTPLEAGLIAGACGLLIAVLGIAWHRRRDRSRLI